MTPWLVEVPSLGVQLARCEISFAGTAQRHEGVHRRSRSCVTCSFTYLVLAAIHEDPVLDFLFLHEAARAEMGRVGARMDLRMVFASAVGRWAYGRAVGNSSLKTRGGGYGMVVRRAGRMADGGPWRRGHDSPCRMVVACFCRTNYV